MCVIIYCKDGKKPTNEILSKCWNGNSDGCGFGIRRGSKLTFRKGLMTKEDAINTIEPIKRFDELVIHFRLATAGGKCEEMTHPFNSIILNNRLLSGRADFLFFHNGHDHRYATKAEKFGWSDSALAAIDAENDELDSFYGKAIIMKSDKTDVLGDFSNVDGILYSNSGWSYTTYSYGNNNWYFDYKTNSGYEKPPPIETAKPIGTTKIPELKWYLSAAKNQYWCIKDNKLLYYNYGQWLWDKTWKDYYVITRKGEIIWYDGGNYSELAKKLLDDHFSSEAQRKESVTMPSLVSTKVP
jgi:predicted glutamine amidotransferase